MIVEPVREADLLVPVLRLFPKRDYRRYLEVPLGRKRIDLHCVPRRPDFLAACVELKLTDWQTALWQASRNFQLAERSYVAIWHTAAARLERATSLLDHYGVGLIIVGPRTAVVARESLDRTHRVARRSRHEVYRYLTET